MDPALNFSYSQENPTPESQLLTEDDALSITSQQSENSDLTSHHHANSNPNIEDDLQIGTHSLLHLSFNQDHGCFAVGTDQGFMLYNCEPFGKRGDFIQLPGFRIVEMLFKSNIFALVGDGRYPQYPPTKVMIWSTLENKFTGDLSPIFEVKAVKLKRDQVIVVLENKIVAYKFSDLKPFHEIKTFKNPKGLCEVSQVSGSSLLVCPGLQKGQVRIEDYAGIRRTKFIPAHDSRLACIALSQDGKLLATASTKGTILRIYNTIDRSLLQEVRRGAYRADIYSIAFSPTAQWLCCSSDKGTVHVFAVKVNSGVLNVEDSECSSSRPLLSFFNKMAPKYFNSEVSVAQFRLPEDIQNSVRFGNNKRNTIVIVGVDGSFYRCQFDPTTGGEMIQLEYHNFLSSEKTF